MRRLVAALALVALTACTTPTAPTPPPTSASSSPSAGSSATPSPTCILTSGAPKPCTTKEFEQEQLTAEAMDVYRRWIKEANRLYLAGGTLTPTDEMKATLSGDFLKSALGVFSDMKQAGVRAVSGEVRIVTLTAKTPESAGTAAFTACEDGSSLIFKRGGKTINRGTFAEEDIVAKRVDGVTVLVAASSEAVAKCAG